MYVAYVTIEMEEIGVTVKGKLESNDQMIRNNVTFDWDGHITE